MDSRVLFLLLIIAGFGMFVNVVLTNPTALHRDISYDVDKLFQNCNISNPVTFTECLRRVRRQAHLHEPAKKTIHRQINVSETSDANNQYKPPIVNITNHIHIHNHYNTSAIEAGTNRNKMNDIQQNCPCYFMNWMPCYCRGQYPGNNYPQPWPYMPHDGYIGNNCICPDDTTHCNECNPAFG